MRTPTVVLSTLVLSTLFAPPSLDAQPTRPAGGDPRAAMQAEARTAMAPFAWLVGEWEGPATVHIAGGGTMSIVQRETVTSGAFGSALLVQGRGTMTVNGAARQVWDAAGLIGYDVPTKKFAMTSASGSGHMQMFGLTTQGEGLTWGFTADGTMNEYVITRTSDGKWKEVGRSSTDGGKSWTTTIEMLLTKVP